MHGFIAGLGFKAHGRIFYYRTVNGENTWSIHGLNRWSWAGWEILNLVYASSPPVICLALQEIAWQQSYPHISQRRDFHLYGKPHCHVPEAGSASLLQQFLVSCFSPATPELPWNPWGTSALESFKTHAYSLASPLDLSSCKLQGSVCWLTLCTIAHAADASSYISVLSFQQLPVGKQWEPEVQGELMSYEVNLDQLETVKFFFLSLVIVFPHVLSGDVPKSPNNQMYFLLKLWPA